MATSHFAATGAALDGSTAVTGSLTTVLGTAPTQANPNTTPNAGINWILFNDQFQAVAMETSLVSTTGNVIYSHPQTNVPISCNGYLYVFCSNQSNADVYFDNLQVIHTRGPVLQEDHYYPAGLLMAGISDHAWNRPTNNYRYQGKEMQDKEFSDGTGLTEYDFGARFYDHQIGRWQTQDPATQYVNPYLAMGDNWTDGVDPNGETWLGNFLRSPWNDVKILAGLFAYNTHQTFGAICSTIYRDLPGRGPQEVVGLGTQLLENTFGLVSKVSYFDGATVVNTEAWLVNSNLVTGETGSAFTIGSFINGPSHMQVDPNDPIFQHEYGRYLQSEADGLAYFTYTAIPDLFSPGNGGPTARDGNARAAEYFGKFYGGIHASTGIGAGVAWDFQSNPISGYDPNKGVNDPLNQAALRSNMRRPGIFDEFRGAIFDDGLAYGEAEAVNGIIELGSLIIGLL